MATWQDERRRAVVVRARRIAWGVVCLAAGVAAGFWLAYQAGALGGLIGK